MADENEDGEQTIPETGAVFTFGRSRFADNAPNRFWIRNDPIKQVACGDEHTLLLTNSGRVFSFGANDWGQLGHGNLKVYTKPTSIKALKGVPAFLVACGRSHSIVALEDKRIVAFGQNSDGELGVGDTEQHNVPADIEDLADLPISYATGGAHHSAALTDDGLLYLWGSNAEGQLGMPHVGEETIRPVHFDFPEKIRHVSCGYYHTAIVTVSGNLFTFGESECGKLGHPVRRNETVKEPRPVDGIQGEIRAVECGGKHTIAVTQEGQMYVFGDGNDGQLGMGKKLTEFEQPRLLDYFAGQKIIYASCGESHTAAITDQNQVFIWGNDQYGKLGLIEDLSVQNNKYFEPQRLHKFAKFDVLQVSCGGCHTIVLAQPNAEWEERELKMPPIARRRLTEEKENLAEQLKREWKEKEQETADHGIENDKGLPKLNPNQKIDLLQGSMNARARRRQSSVSNSITKDHPTSLADRAVSISAEIHRSLNEKFDKSVEDSDDSSKGRKDDSDMNSRKQSETELLHKELNRSLSVFRRDTLEDENAPMEHTKNIPDHPGSDESTSDAKPGPINHRGPVYARQSIPIQSGPPTRITAAAQKYGAIGINEPSSSVSEKRRHEENEPIDNESGFQKSKSAQDGFDDDDEGLTMGRIERRRDSQASEIADLNGERNQNFMAKSDESKPGVKPAFAEPNGQIDTAKNQGPMKRLSNLISRVKDQKAKANGENHHANGKESTSSESKQINGKKSRACSIL